MLPIVMTGGALSEVDFAIARSCYMGSYDVTSMLPQSQRFTLEDFCEWHLTKNTQGMMQQIPVENFRFDETSRDNNIIIQMFEFESLASDASPMKKLVIVPGGMLSSKNTEETGDLYYIGKLFWGPEDQQPRFVPIFHLVLCDKDLASITHITSAVATVHGFNT